MVDKIYVIVIYCVLGILLSLSPCYYAMTLLNYKPTINLNTNKFLKRFATKHINYILSLLVFIWLWANNMLAFNLYTGLISLLAITVVLVRHLPFFTLSIESIATFQLVMFGAAISGTLLYWRRGAEGYIVLTNNWEILLLFLSWVGTTVALIYVKDTDKKLKFFSLVVFALYSCIVCFLSFSTTTLGSYAVLGSLWHHWGAYIGPAELLLEGMRPYIDMPIQYGLGPTMFLAMACLNKCWSGAYLVFGFLTFLYAVVIGLILLSYKLSRLQCVILFLIGIITTLAWSGYPPVVMNTLATPSVSGTRFLPLLFLTAYMILCRSKLNLRWYRCGGIGLWCFGMIWSPESAVYVTFLWWSLWLFDISLLQETSVRSFSFFRVELMKAGGIFVTLVLVLVLFHRSIFGEFLSIGYYFAYLISPPGEMPINWRGNVWFFIICIATSIYLTCYDLIKTKNIENFRRSLILQLTLYIAASYFLGRSHENNMLNLAPLLFLILVDSYCYTLRYLKARIYICVMLSSFLCFPFLFGWKNLKTSLEKEDWLLSGISPYIKKMSYGIPSTRDGLVPANVDINLEDAHELMRIISGRRESFTILDPNYNLHPEFDGRPWTVVYPSANYTYFKPENLEKFISSSMLRLQRAGWVIVRNHPTYTAMLPIFDTYYRRTEEIISGQYLAIRYFPKSKLGD
jgi:hypothetical protein